MCYQTRQIKTVKDLELRYNVKISNPSYRDLFDQPAYHLNGFAHPHMLIIPQQKSSVLAPGIWGIVPSQKSPEHIKDYYKESLRYGSGLNAQSEKLFNHFIYKNVALTQRCIIPVTGFFEPHTYEKKKYPVYIHRKDDAVFSLAGIYTILGKHVTFTILTKAANSFFSKIHNQKNRQPLILNPEDEEIWLTNDINQNLVSQIISKDYSVSDLEAYPVSKDLYKNSVDSNTDSITKPVAYKELRDVSFV